MNLEDYDSPLTVHVCWSTTTPNANPIRAQLGKALYEFLCRPLRANVAVDPGVGIPVRVGTDSRQLVTLATQVLKNNQNELSRLVTVLLLDQGARFDEQFCAAVDFLLKAGGIKGLPRLLVLPVLLDQSWSVSDEVAPCRAAAFVPNTEKKIENAIFEVSTAICHFLMNSSEAESRRRVTIFVSHANADRTQTSELATQLRDYINGTELRAFFDANDVERGRQVGKQIEQAQKEAVFLSVRTDGYSQSPYCLDEVLTAKKFGVPIVCVQALMEGEQRSLAYGGNAFTYVRRNTQDELRVITSICLQAWLRHLHFHHSAPAVLKLHGVPLRPFFLSRPPELIDFAHSLALRDKAALVMYPDPPLPQAEIAVIQSAYPKVRLTTPTTLHRRLLRRVASPLLDGDRVALSLSDCPEIPNFENIVSGQTKPEARGLTSEHMRDVIAHLTLSLITAGVELGYGGDLRNEGYTRLLSDLIESYRRTTKTSRDLLFNYLAAYLVNPEAGQGVSARFITCTANVSNETSPEVKAAFELAAMRLRMAQDCSARIILGGKTAPKSNLADKAGYAGRLPGQAEEAWRHLSLGKPLYVAGGFGGCAQLVAKALCGDIASLRSDSPSFPVSEHYRPLRDSFDNEARRQGATPFNLDSLWAFFAEQGKGFFHGQAPNNDEWTKEWTNGLTVAENRRLFVSIHPEEIGSLVLTGLLRLRDRQRGKANSPLQIMLFNGSITEAPDVDSYAVPVLLGAHLRGADGALDAALDGAIQRNLEQQTEEQEFEGVIPVAGGRLPGDYVILQSIGDLSKMSPSQPKELDWLREKVQGGMAEIVAHLKRLGLDSPAVVLFGSNLGLSVRDSTLAMINGLIEAGAGTILTSLTVCEMSRDRYQELLKLTKELVPDTPVAPNSNQSYSLAEKVRFTELRSEKGVLAVDAPKPAILLNVLRQGQDLVVHAIAPVRSTAVPLERKAVDWREIMKLTHAFGGGEAPDLGLQGDLGSKLAEAVLPDHVRDTLIANPRIPIDVYHDIEAAAIPFELLCFGARPNHAPRWPAKEGGIRRCLLVANPPRKFRSHTREVRLRLLLIADPSKNLPVALKEAKKIQETFSARSDIYIKSLIRDEATYENVLRELQSQTYDILHFAGHAEFNARERDKSGIRLAADRMLLAKDLIDSTLEQLPALIVLNACEAGRLRAEAPQPETGQEATVDASLAEAIISTGIPAFIGNLWKVKDDAAGDIAVSLYRNLASGRTLGEALLAGRQDLFNDNKSDWLNYMFFGDPELRI